MGELVYILCAVAAAACMYLLVRGYRRTGTRLLFWSALCFACLTLNNLLIAVDLLVLPGTNLYPVRILLALLGMMSLLYGLIREPR
jgi:hypothetical protein